jgi:cell division protein FtsB
LSLFTIQKSLNKFLASLHLKVNELISLHGTFLNAVLNAEIKTVREITKLSKEYTELAEQIKGLNEELKEDYSREQNENMHRKESDVENDYKIKTHCCIVSQKSIDNVTHTQRQAIIKSVFFL